MTAIGVFDSGVGGLTVVRELRRRFPAENILYLGDTARVPYGTKSPRTVERYALRCQEFLLRRQVKLMLVACNTASANALPALIKASPVPVIGAVEPGARAALQASSNHHVGVLGTLGTIRSSAYESALLRLNTGVKVAALPCPLFVPLAEEGWAETDIAEAVARKYLSALFRDHPKVDTLVLGCTHYPLLRKVIERVCLSLCNHQVALVDSAHAMGEQAATYLEDSAAGNSGELRCFVTDATRLEELAPRFLGEAPVSVELVDL